MTPIADIIARLLIQVNVSHDLSGAWPTYVSFLPDVTQAVVVYETPGEQDGRIMQTGERIERPGIQIRVRAQDYTDASNKAWEIARKLDEQNDVEVEIDSSESYTIQNISRRATPMDLGPEGQDGSNRRFNFTVNAVVTYRKQ